jgi:hypothetical protein
MATSTAGERTEMFITRVELSRATPKGQRGQDSDADAAKYRHCLLPKAGVRRTRAMGLAKSRHAKTRSFPAGQSRDATPMFMAAGPVALVAAAPHVVAYGHCLGLFVFGTQLDSRARASRRQKAPWVWRPPHPGIRNSAPFSRSEPNARNN